MNLSEKALQELKEKKSSIEDLNDLYFINSQDEVNVNNILKLLDENICSFQEIVDKFKSIKDPVHDPCLHVLLKAKELFEELIDNNVLNKEDLEYLLNKIDDYFEVSWLCYNTPLIEYILDEFVLNKEDVDRFNTMIENRDDEMDRWCEEHNIHTLFDLIEFEYKNNEEILKLNDLNKYIYFFDLNEDQKLELIKVLKNNETAQNRLNQIVDNHLESNYNFGSLMNYLKKQEKKNILNI